MTEATGAAGSAANVGFAVTTGLELPGVVVEKDLGVAFGLVVRSMGFARAVGAGLKSLRQGEVSQYTALLEDSRRHAVDRMIENAKLLGANGATGGTVRGGAPRRRRRGAHAETSTPEPSWLPTAERFRDPTSGRVIRVWVDPVAGSRHYVPDDTAP